MTSGTTALISCRTPPGAAAAIPSKDCRVTLCKSLPPPLAMEVAWTRFPHQLDLYTRKLAPGLLTTLHIDSIQGTVEKLK